MHSAPFDRLWLRLIMLLLSLTMVMMMMTITVTRIYGTRLFVGNTWATSYTASGSVNFFGCAPNADGTRYIAISYHATDGGVYTYYGNKHVYGWSVSKAATKHRMQLILCFDSYCRGDVDPNKCSQQLLYLLSHEHYVIGAVPSGGSIQLSYDFGNTRTSAGPWGVSPCLMSQS